MKIDPAIKQLFRELAPDCRGNNDPWGHCMGAFFDVAGEMYRRGMSTPDAWKYSPGAGGPDVSEDARAVFDMLDTTDAQLQILGEYLQRVTNRLDRLGYSY